MSQDTATRDFDAEPQGPAAARQDSTKTRLDLAGAVEEGNMSDVRNIVTRELGDRDADTASTTVTWATVSSARLPYLPVRRQRRRTVACASVVYSTVAPVCM
ncbi:hypothetical protein HMPREF1624_04607 [Sporothrix schenckii ATCC 58251]|uniref:Uncharacterized protein n=1 Tax=Sporothrix schenckii (strain ATCC 58251 / de Perez 2211183) TaxID=1391915 RepID=U7PV17_SPOS1|nr:hypothetical protein HMPREF1624_04607 [Sporothrix schenckii ATCC 58251]